MCAESVRAGDYIRAVYDRLDACLASGAQWNYTPGWNTQTKDGWNAEDFNIIHPSGTHRPNFRSRPYPRATAGTPLRFRYEDLGPSGAPRRLEFDWTHDPRCGETEIFLSNALFPPGSTVELQSSGVTWHRDPVRQVIVCRAATAMTISLRVTAPAVAGHLATDSDQTQEARRGAG